MWNGTRDFDGCPDKGRLLLVVKKRRMRFARVPRVLASGRLNARARAAVAVLGKAIRRLGLRRVELHVVAGYGLSYGDSVQRARLRAVAVKAALVRRAKLHPDAITIFADGPDGRPRVEVRYR